MQLSEMSDEMLEQIANLSESRILKLSKDDLRMEEQQLLWSQALWNDVRDYWTSLNHHWKAQTLPRCTCADHENGFMAKEKWNPYYAYGEPCSIKLYEEWKDAQASAKTS